MPSGKFQLSYRHLNLIGEKFFDKSPVIAIREMIQNAHDAVLMRAARTNGGNPPPQNWGVKIDLDPINGTISVTDTGIGMNYSDITENLTVLGASSKIKISLEESVKGGNPSWLKNVVGNFGFGFIAGLAIADKIELWSKKVGENKAVYCCFERNREDYIWEEKQSSETPQVGTRVKLIINQQCQVIDGDETPEFTGGNILSKDTIQQIVRKYCDLLQFQIWVNDEPVNLIYAPWEGETNPQPTDYFRFFRRRYGDDVNEPIAYIPFDFKESKGKRLEASGVLYIPKPSIMGRETEEGSLDVFVKRFWVCDGEADILPPWARFLKGVIISSDLITTLDRRGLGRTHESYYLLKSALRDKLYDYFFEIAATQQNTYNLFLTSFGRQFKAGMIKEYMDKDERGLHKNFTLLLRTIPLISYSQNAPQGKRQNLNQYLSLQYGEPITAPAGKKRQVYSVGRPVPPDRDIEFRNIISDKSFAIYVPENEIDVILITVIASSFDNVLEILDVEKQFMRNFIQLLTGEERERWSLFEGYIQNLIQSARKEGEAPNITVGNVPRSELPIVFVWTPMKGGEDRIEILEIPTIDALSKGRFQYKQTIVINSRHQLMQDLLDYKERNRLEQLEGWMGEILHQAHHLAVLDYVGGMDTKTLQDVTQTDIINLLNIIKFQKEISEMKSGRDKLQAFIQEKEQQVITMQAAMECIKVGNKSITVPTRPERRECAVLITDLINSSYILAGLDFKEKGVLFKEYIDILSNKARENGGFFDKFTGDGILVLFGIDEIHPDLTAKQKFCNNALLFATEIEALTRRFLTLEHVREKLQNCYPVNAPLDAFSNRIAISFGHVAFGLFGDTASAVGSPIVEAARMCAEKSFFSENSNGIIFSGDFLDASQQPHNFGSIVKKDFEPRGLWRKLDVYKKS